MKFPMITVLLVGASATFVLAQQRREPIRGSVEHADGSAWANVRVHLLSRPLPHDERFGAPDEISTVSDAKGRFSADLLIGRHYLAWAVEELADDRYRASFPVEQVIAGRPLGLVADGPRKRRRFKFNGLDAWRARGTVVAKAFTETEPRVVVSRELTGDDWHLPALPCRRALVELTCDGLPLLDLPRRIDLTKPHTQLFKLHTPRAVRVRVTDRHGQPLSGAKLYRRTPRANNLRGLNAPLGATGVDGNATVTLPIPSSRKFWRIDYRMGVRARGFAPTGYIKRVDIPMDHDPSTSPPAIDLELPPGATHTVSLASDGRPYVAAVLLSTRQAYIGGRPNRTQSSQRWMTPHAEGRIELSRLPHQPALLHAPTESLSTPGRVAAPLHPVALVAAIPADEARKHIPINLDSLAPLQFKVTLDAVPVHDARIAVLVRNGTEEVRLALEGLLSDRRGLVAALVPPGCTLTIVAWNDDGFALARDIVAKAGIDRIELALTHGTVLPGRVIDANGDPVAFATVLCSCHNAAPAIAELPQAIRQFRVTTARDGTFSLPLFAGLDYSLSAVITPGDTFFFRRKWTAGTNQPEKLVLDVSEIR